MIDFVNTLDTVSDAALVDKLIDRSISGAFNDDKIAKIGSNAFRGCKNLTSVCFPVATTIGGSAFNGSGLKAITPETFPFVTNNIGASAFAYSALETVVWPSLTVDNNSKFDNDGVFRDCISLRSVDFTNLNKPGGRMFQGCKSLKDVNLPVITSVPAVCFRGCAALETITLPLVASIDGEENFHSCTNLRVVDLPVCTSIYASMTFWDSPKIEAIILRSTTVCTLSGVGATSNTYQYWLKNTPIVSGEGYIYVPRDLVDSYKAATNWSSYDGSIFRAIEDYPDICGG